MGYKKIQEKRKELYQKEEVKETFVKAVEDINASLAAMGKAIANVERTREDVQKRISALNTFGVKEFDDYKKSLLAICIGWGVRALPMTPVQQVVDKSQKELNEMISAWEDKLAASFPKDVKPGMTFKNHSLRRIYEIQTGPTKATNINLKGDDAIWFKVKFWVDGKDGGAVDINLTDLKKMKYLNTL